MAENPRDTVTVADAPERARFEITVDSQPAGFADYRLEPGRIVFTHTEVDAAYAGQGLASQLARAALDTGRERGLQVTPLCPYIANFIRKYPEYLDLVDAEHRERVS